MPKRGSTYAHGECEYCGADDWIERRQRRVTTAGVPYTQKTRRCRPCRNRHWRDWNDRRRWGS